MPNNNNSHKPKIFIVGGICLLAGVWLKSMQVEEFQKSRSEKDDSDFVDEVKEEIGELLEDLEFEEDMDDEEDFHTFIADYLEECSEFEIETEPSTLFGKPDILIGGVLALEIKYNPNKSEIDRCIGQCANYSREWTTWIILYDTPSSKIQYLEEVLKDKGLDNIPIISFD